MPGSVGGGWCGVFGGGAWVSVRSVSRAAMTAQIARAAMTSTVCRAIAGDNAVSLAPPDGLPTAEQLDAVVPPAEARHILDADSSQHEAIEAVKRGAHLVMDGPPGTGKSQTIANMIGALLHAGKTVLLVSQKAAALDVVAGRLTGAGLGRYLLELHSGQATRKEVAASLARGVFGSPFFIIDGEPFWGVDRIPMLEDWIKSGGW